MEPKISIITLGVADMPRAIQFYRDGLGLPTSVKDDDAAIVFFQTSGTCLAIYPFDKLAEDVWPSESRASIPACSNERDARSTLITLAHNVRSKEEVEQVLELAEKSGGKIVKPAQDVFWGGYSGYFTDPDGTLWEVATGDCWEFNDDGSLVIP